MNKNAIFSKDAEEALIGSLIIDGSLLEGLDVEPHDFYMRANAIIFEAILAVHDAGKKVDILTVSDELRRVGKFDEVGGFTAVAGLHVPSSMNVESYAEIIKNKAHRRRAVEHVTKVAEAAYDDTADMDSIVASTVEVLVKDSGKRGGAIEIKHVASALYDKVAAAYGSPQEYYGIPTGMPKFDKITAGLQRGEVVMLAGEPGVGKSSLAMQMCLGMARGNYGLKGTPGVVYELEMSAEATWRRITAFKSGVRSANLRSGKLSGEDWNAFTEATDALSDYPIFISDRTDWTTLSMKADIARLKATANIGWVLIDYMGLLKDEPRMEANERSAIVSDRVHDIAKDMDVAVVAVHDMTKAGMSGQTSGQAGLAGSRRVMYNADAIIFLKLEKPDDPSNLRLEWAKFREDSADRFIRLARIDGQAAFTEI